jgi:threonine synthase
MYEKHIICTKCRKRYAINSFLFRCEKCGGNLEVVFDYKKLKKAVSWAKFKRRPFSHARYKELFPVKELISLQEGGTPLIRSRNIEKKLGLKFGLYFKYEAVNPTGSFKDRGSSVEVAKAEEFFSKKKVDEKNVVCASTGNMGASVSAYSAVQNFRCSILTPKDVVQLKLEQILAYGAEVYHFHASYAKVARLAEQMARKRSFYLLGDYLYRREGTKSVGFEIAEQLKDVDYIFSPIGNGTLISACWKAFRELKTLGLRKKLPRMAGIQARKCSPVVKAFRNKSDIKPVRNPKTVAMAIECGDPMDGVNALKAVRESGGFAESVDDREILKARMMLSREEGLFAEPSGAVSLAGLLSAAGMVEENSKVVCLITGHGLKSPYTGVEGKPIEVKSLKIGKYMSII